MRAGSVGRAAAGVAAGLFVTVWLGVVLLPWILPNVGPLLLTATGVLSVAVGVFAVRRIRPKHNEGKLTWRVWWVASIMPLVGSARRLVDWIRGGVTPRWALTGDMVWNTVQSQFIHADGGVQPALHPNPAPLTNLLFAIGYGPLNGPSLGLVFGVHAVVIILLAAGSSLLSGLYVARRSEGLNPFVRACFVFAVGWLPYTGALLGVTIWYGHANGLTSYFILWLAWIIFSEPSISYLKKVSLLLALATVVASSWAPLVVVPVALAATSGVFAFRGWRRGQEVPWRDLWLPTLMVVQLGVYAFIVTLPDLKRDIGGLSADGAALPFSLKTALALMLLLVLTAVITALLSKCRPGGEEVREVALGVGAVLLLSCPVLAYMMWQRIEMESLWGYYPIKFATLLITVLAGVLIASIAGIVPARFGFVRQVLAGVTAVPLFVAALIPAYHAVELKVLFAPSVTQSNVIAPDVDARAIETLIEVFDGDPFSAQIAVGVEQDPGMAHLINNYLIQLSADRSRDPIRTYAYTLETENTQQVCDLIGEWGRKVTVHTAREKVDEVTERLDQCDSGSFTVEPVEGP